MDIDYWQIHMYNFFAHFWLQHINGLNIVQKKEEEELEEYNESGSEIDNCDCRVAPEALFTKLE